MLAFGLFFWGVHAGVGQFWDWSFPYFSDQTNNIFGNKDSAWIAASGGSPLGYASDYFFRFLTSLFGFMSPELLHYFMLVLIFAAGSFGMYLLSRPYTNNWLAFLLGLLTFVNPTVFYKYTAGHLNYLVSFTIFIYFLHYLLNRFDKNLYSAVMVGVLFALLGIQIQFFIIGGIFLIVYLLLNRQKVGLRYLLVMLALPILINLVWLSNFLTGGASTTETSAAAAKVSVKQSGASTFLNIFTFSFSKATLLSKFYAFYELLWNATLYLFLFWLLVREKRKERFDVVLLIFLVIAIFLATGLYQMLQLYPLTVLYPMMREVGHFAPVIVLVALLLIARLVQKSTWRWALLFVITGSLFIVGIKFQYYSQSYDAGKVRTAFAPFKDIAERDADEYYRVLAYPFFDKYAIKGEKQTEPGLFPLQNSGHDSMAAYASQEYMQNAIAPHEFQESPQYKLLQSYNIDVLRPHNVKYIFDFSHVYESNYDLYVPAATYNNDLSLIKNDPKFFEKLLAANPGRLRKVNDRVLEIIDYTPRVAATADMFVVPDEEQTIETSVFTRSELKRAFDHVTDDAVPTKYASVLSRLFDSPERAELDKKTGTFKQSLDIAEGSQARLYLNRSYRTLYYEATEGQLTISSEAAAPLLLNGEPLADSATDDRQVLTQVQLKERGPYYLSFQGTIVPIEPGKSGRLGTGKAGDEVELFRGESSNLATNPSFENGLWQGEVGDCNNYDGEARLGMKQDSMASDGQSSLLLSATRHNACTSTPLKLEREKQYLLSLDYQSGNAPTSSFYLAYDDEFVPIAKGSRAVTDNKWHTMSTIFETEAGLGGNNARLFLYALEGDGRTATVNRYDNIMVTKLAPAGKITIPTDDVGYAAIDLPGGDHQFAFQDDGYQYRNLIANPSFEQGSWQPKVGDCNNYDGKPAIAMRLDQQNKSAGKQALELSATKHDACVRATANVTADTEYLLRFDYQTQDTKTYGYAVSYDDPTASIVRKQLTSKGSGWQTADIQIRTPARATTMTLYLYAFEGNGRGANIVRYDNISLVALPDFTDRFFVVQQPTERMSAPKSISFRTPSQSIRTIDVKGAKDAFYVTLSETYHAKWRLALDNAAVSSPVNRWLPSAKADTNGLTHMELNTAVNAWLVEPSKLCQTQGGALRGGCTKNSDGSYDIQMVAEFTPQRWFAINALISWAVLFGSVGYLVAVRQDILPKYHYLRDRVAARNRRRL